MKVQRPDKRQKKKYGSPPGRAPPAIERHVSAHHSGALRRSPYALKVSTGRVRNHWGLVTKRRKIKSEPMRQFTSQSMKQSLMLAGMPEMTLYETNSEPVNLITSFLTKNRLVRHKCATHTHNLCQTNGKHHNQQMHRPRKLSNPLSKPRNRGKKEITMLNCLNKLNQNSNHNSKALTD